MTTTPQVGDLVRDQYCDTPHPLETMPNGNPMILIYRCHRLAGYVPQSEKSAIRVWQTPWKTQLGQQHLVTEAHVAALAGRLVDGLTMVEPIAT